MFRLDNVVHPHNMDSNSDFSTSLFERDGDMTTRIRLSNIICFQYGLAEYGIFLLHEVLTLVLQHLRVCKKIL